MFVENIDEILSHRNEIEYVGKVTWKWKCQSDDKWRNEKAGQALMNRMLCNKLYAAYVIFTFIPSVDSKIYEFLSHEYVWTQPMELSSICTHGHQSIQCFRIRFVKVSSTRKHKHFSHRIYETLRIVWLNSKPPMSMYIQSSKTYLYLVQMW